MAKGYRAKVRNAHNRKRRPVILVMAEGRNKTETMYFNDLRRECGQPIRFVSRHYTDPVKMVEALLEEYEKQELSFELGDMGYCLLDSDCDPAKNSQIAKADRIAAAGDTVKVLVSSPCFEIWFLCHFTASAKKYGSNEAVLVELRKYIKDYQKNTQNMFAQTKSLLPMAIHNAQILRDICERNGYAYHTVAYSPSTEIDVLVKKLKEFSD